MPIPPGSETVSTTSCDIVWVNTSKDDMHALLVGNATKLGVLTPQPCHAFSLFVLVQSSSPVPTPAEGIPAILISGLKIRLTCGEGSLPAVWQFARDRIVSHCITPL